VKRNLFVYGLLQHPEVLKPLIGYVPEISAAVVHDHTRRILQHDDFEPCAVAVVESGLAIEGKILHQVPPQAVAYLDEFECIDRGIYARQSVISSLSCGSEVACDIYVRGPALADSNIGGYWNQSEFNERHMEYVLTELVPRYANF